MKSTKDFNAESVRVPVAVPAYSEFADHAKPVSSLGSDAIERTITIFSGNGIDFDLYSTESPKRLNITVQMRQLPEYNDGPYMAVDYAEWLRGNGVNEITIEAMHDAAIGAMQEVQYKAAVLDALWENMKR